MPNVLKKIHTDISVIIPTYNRLPMLEEAIESALSQTFNGTVEIIVIDDNSQDGTSKIVHQKYPSIRLISLKENVGAYAARNLGLQNAKGNFIAFLDSDDLWEPNYLLTQITVLRSRERCFSISGLVSWDTVSNQKVIRVQKPKLDKYISPLHHLLSGGSFIFSPTSVVFPRKLFDEVGLFDEMLRVGGDTDLYIRCLLAGYHPVFTEIPAAIRRRHTGDQLTNTCNIEVRRKDRIARVEKYYSLVRQCADIVPMKQVYAEIYAYFARQYFMEKKLTKWLLLSLGSVWHNPQYAISKVTPNIKALVR